MFSNSNLAMHTQYQKIIAIVMNSLSDTLQLSYQFMVAIRACMLHMFWKTEATKCMSRPGGCIVYFVMVLCYSCHCTLTEFSTNLAFVAYTFARVICIIITYTQICFTCFNKIKLQVQV